MTEIATRLSAVHDRIARAARAAKRSPSDVALIAVTKRRPFADIDALASAGVVHFGENRVEEATEKWSDRPSRRAGLTLHMIGQVQSKKAGDVVRLFDVVHSLDRPSLLDALVSEGERAGRFPSVYVQVNIGDEPQKGGVALHDLPPFLDRVRQSPLPLAGLMAMPPLGVQPSPYFALLATLGRRHDVQGLSMGMSGDFEQAVRQGATAVRIGSALFED